jgi:hypothetical protein
MGTGNVVGSSFCTNYAGFAAGIFNANGTLRVGNCMVKSDSASSAGWGSGIASSGTAVILNSRFTV